MNKTNDDQTKDLWELAKEVILDSEEWMNTPNLLCGGDCPKDWIRTDKEQVLREDLLRIKYGIFS